MSVARAFLVGLAAALVLLLVLRFGDDLTLVVVPLAILGASAVFSPIAGWRARLIRGAFGAALAGALGIAAVFYLSGRTDWFDWPDEQGGDLFFILLVALAAIPGGTAAAASSPARGLALATGFSLGLHAPLVFARPANPGILVLLGLGTLVGTLVCTFGRPSAR